MPNLKYHTEISAIEDCPYDNTEELNKECYRFVKNTVNINSFEPPAIINPSRNFKREEKCSSYATSMYSDESAARESYNILKSINKLIHKTIGNKLAKGEVRSNLGLCGKENRHKHFDFFEYEETDLSSFFDVIGDL